MDRQIIDFHSHILPCADHGSSSLAESLEQLRTMIGFGTELAVATPHFYPHVHTVDDFLSKRDSALELLIKSKQKIDLCLGAEVLLCKNLDRLDGLSRLCIKGTEVLLIELPLRPLGQEYFDTAEAIMDSGYTVVLAHIDRYLKKYPESVNTLLELGALAQINAEALYSSGMRRRIFELLETSDRICALGSDLHGTDTKVYRKFVNSERLLGEHYEEIMSRSRRLLQNAEIY